MPIPRCHLGRVSQESQEGAVHLPGCHPTGHGPPWLECPPPALTWLVLTCQRLYMLLRQYNVHTGAPPCPSHGHTTLVIWARQECGLLALPRPAESEAALQAGPSGGVTHTEVRGTAQDTGRILCGSGKYGSQAGERSCPAGIQVPGPPGT